MNKTKHTLLHLFKKRTLLLSIILITFSSTFLYAQLDWKEKESEHFKILFKETHAHLVDHILSSAEKSYDKLSKIFDYSPSEKIIIATYDVYDYGFASATSVPQNFIRVEIEPFEPMYENVLYNDRFQWVISHELLHVIVNDKSSNLESFFRTLFSKVQPEKSEPLTVPFSVLTNYHRYSPRWHQEAIAVFWETWLSGGFGRIFGSFDEAYFRTMTLDNKEFPSILSLDAKLSHNSFLLESLFYLYGTRFASHLVNNYGVDKFVEWYKTKPGDVYLDYSQKFEQVYGIDIDEAWEGFIKSEKEFQQKNIEKIKSASLTPIRELSEKPYGWVTEPHYDSQNNSIIFGYHKSHHLAALYRLSLDSEDKSEELASLPTPNMNQVASTAFDEKTGLLFFTTNNNQLYRDMWALDTKSKDKKMLFRDARVGNMSISSLTGEMWATKHSQGKVYLVYSPFPYRELDPFVGFKVGDELHQLAVSPDGSKLAAVLKRTNGEQSLILVNLSRLKAGDIFNYKTIIDAGSPENPSWSPDQKNLYWNAYNNGVSNIYKINLSSGEMTAMSNCLRGLYKPLYINSDSLFAFQYTIDGFRPVMIPNKPAEKLPAINYYGQQLFEKYPELGNYAIVQTDTLTKRINVEPEKLVDYNSLENLKILSFIPVITGFQFQKVLGFYTHISDPLLEHDLTMEFGVSPFKEKNQEVKFHMKLKYDYKKHWTFSYDYNATDFYDLFNDRKRGMLGSKITLGNIHYWLYDNPLKIKQNTQVALYTGVRFINDNLVKVSQPDFFVAQTHLNLADLRRSIGSSNHEYGNEFDATLMVFGSNPDNPQYSAQFYTEYGRYGTWLIPHNAFHIKLMGGYHQENENLFQSKFFFGGFGNRNLENVDVKQYRKVFRFPGIPIYSLASDRFLKLLVENDIPPLRFSGLGIGNHYLNHIDISMYSQTLWTNTTNGELWSGIGAQMDIVFKHWFNLESTFSAGVAKAWHGNESFFEWFLSFKLLKN